MIYGVKSFRKLKENEDRRLPCSCVKGFSNKLGVGWGVGGGGAVSGEPLLKAARLTSRLFSVRIFEMCLNMLLVPGFESNIKDGFIIL